MRGRAYKVVSVCRAAARGFNVTLDGRVLRTPAQQDLTLPTEQLAWAIASEWDSQGKKLAPHTMPLMKLATTAVDQAEEIRPAMTDSMLRILNADAACMRSDEPVLAAKEAAAFDPLLAWLKTDLELPLSVTESLSLEHPEGTVERAAAMIADADAWDLSGLDSLASSCKSFALALAVRHGCALPLLPDPPAPGAPASRAHTPRAAATQAHRRGGRVLRRARRRAAPD